MADLSTLLLALSCVTGALALFALFRYQRLRGDLERAAEGSMLGVEFGAFNLPQAQLSPDADVRRQCRQWSTFAVVAMTLAVVLVAISMAV